MNDGVQSPTGRVKPQISALSSESYGVSSDKLLMRRLCIIRRNARAGTYRSGPQPIDGEPTGTRRDDGSV